MSLHYLQMLHHIIFWAIPIFSMITLCLSFLLIHTKSSQKININLTAFQLSTLTVIFLGYLLLRHHAANFTNLFFLDKINFKWISVLFVFYACVLLIYYFKLQTTRRWVIEREVCVVLLFWFWATATLSLSFFSIIVFLELCGLLLLAIFALQINSSLQSTPKRWHSTNTLYQFLSSIIVFLWLSAFSLLWVLWFVFLAYPQVAIRDVSTIVLFTNLTSEAANFWKLNVLVGLAFSLKLMLFPWQAVMLSFYSGLPLSSFISYLVFYYTGFLVLFTKTLLCAFSFFFTSWFCIFANLSPVLVLILFLHINRTVDIKFIFTISSTLSICFILFTSLGVVYDFR